MGYLSLENYIQIEATADGSPMTASLEIITPPLDDVSVKANAIEGKVYAGNLEVLVNSGSIPGWTLVSSVNITIKPTTILNCKLDNKHPLTIGDNGSANGTFTNGDSEDTKTIVLTVIASGQDKVDMV